MYDLPVPGREPSLGRFGLLMVGTVDGSMVNGSMGVHRWKIKIVVIKKAIGA